MNPSVALRPDSLGARDVANHLHSFTNLRQHEIDGPLVIERGQGIYVWDDRGKRYIEGMSGLWCTTLGFSEERLAAVAAAQMHKLPYNHTFRGRSHDVTIELAERLIALAPAPMSKVLFASSGSEANDTALKIVAYYNSALGRPERRKVIARVNGYHGTTIATSSLTGIADLHKSFHLSMSDVVRVEYPHHWRFAATGESEDAYATRLAQNLERTIVEAGPETIAAFIAEPVMGVGAVIVPPPSYFEKIQAVLSKYEILFIADEVICGFGRTGNMWGSQTFGIRPDIVTTAKGLSSAYLPISAVMVNDAIYRAMVAESGRIGIFGHGYTNSGHPVCASVALEVLKIYEERDILGNVRAVAPALHAGLRRLAASPIVGEVRGVGLMAAIELVADKHTKKSFPPERKLGQLFAAKAQEYGLFVRPIGDAIVMAPPLIITAAQIDDMLEVLGRALGDVESAVRQAP